MMHYFADARVYKGSVKTAQIKPAPLIIKSIAYPG
jgi:hypothetical protein